MTGMSRQLAGSIWVSSSIFFVCIYNKSEHGIIAHSAEKMTSQENDNKTPLEGLANWRNWIQQQCRDDVWRYPPMKRVLAIAKQLLLQLAELRKEAIFADASISHVGFF